MELVISEAAAKALAALPKGLSERIMTRMEAIAAEPFGRHPQVKPLAGQANYRLRVGDWRAIYAVDRTGRRVILENVKNRREAYR